MLWAVAARVSAQDVGIACGSLGRRWIPSASSFRFGDRMYRNHHSRQLEFPDFYLPFSGHLDPENRWIVLAGLVPWDLAESIYHAQLCEDFGAPSVPARTALGALLIKERLGLTDRETVEAIGENPYLQFFIGREDFTCERPFDASLMVDFRKRFGEDGLQQLSEAIVLASLPSSEITTETKPEDHDDPDTLNAATDESDAASQRREPNRGQLLADATCAPADIRYPTDVSLLNEAREKTDAIIDELHRPLIGKVPRARTYRQKARRKFTAFVKKKKPSRKFIRRATRQQLGYLRRNLQAIDLLLQTPDSLPLTHLGRRLYKNLLVCHEVFRQQLAMYETKSKRIDDRIVSISQPHVRPIVRGKAGRATEFGAKLSVSVIDGFSFVDRLDWNSFHEGLDLPGQIEGYRARFGFYPESVHVDQVYRTRANRALCKLHGIRMSGPALGRRPKDVPASTQRQAARDEAIRNGVEGKFGQGKRRFGLGRVMAKLASTSGAMISLTFLVMNLELALQRFFLSLLSLWSAALLLVFYPDAARLQPPHRPRCPLLPNGINTPATPSLSIRRST